jgi:uncharacterized protein (DUF1015 family)
MSRVGCPLFPLSSPRIFFCTMADIRPFAGIHYAQKPELNLSNLIAPPYDVLDEAGKAALQARHPNNIVNIDLPHMPPKTVGPDEVYERAKLTYQSWRSEGVLMQDSRPALYPYEQTYTHAGKTYHRRGFIALVRLTPFGQDVIPHEKTYKGPIEDRLKLMRSTGLQLSPIFGLYPDAKNEVTDLLFSKAAKPEFSATMDDVQNDMWSVIDADIENRVIDLMKSKNIYIADGHHRYTTALQYQFEQIQANGGKPLPENHPANYCMFVLIGMQDPGLLILPTHRLIGNLDRWDFQKFSAMVDSHFNITETPLRPDHVDELAETLPGYPPHTMGLFDGRSKKLYTLQPRDPDLLAPYEPNQSKEWRALDVAILQRYLLDEVLQPHFASPGKELTRGYTPDPHAVAPQVDGEKYQIALLLQPTPLKALEDLGRHGEVMPQKSTYFFPKLATGMVINPLR